MVALPLASTFLMTALTAHAADWHVRNSWGEFYGEMGYLRLAHGSNDIESGCNWATPGSWTEHNFPCDEGGDNCAAAAAAAGAPQRGFWVEPALTGIPLGIAVTLPPVSH